jgi:hypothetical protein
VIAYQAPNSSLERIKVCENKKWKVCTRLNYLDLSICSAVLQRRGLWPPNFNTELVVNVD